MILTPAQKQTLLALWEAREVDFATLVEISGLNPARDFRGANLEGVQFGSTDLTGFDFTSANLRNADLRKAKASDAIFNGAMMEGAALPKPPSREPSPRGIGGEGLRYYQREAVRLVLERLDAGYRRAAVVMAQGTGKHVTMLTLLQALAGREKLQSVLVLASTKASVKELERAFDRGAGGWVDQDGQMIWDTPKGPVRLTLSTIQGIDKRLKREPAPRFSHVLYLDPVGGHYTPKALREAFIDCREIAFFSTVPSKELADWREHIVHIYESAQAVADGYLLPLDVHDCTAIVAGPVRPREVRTPLRLDDDQLRRAVRHFIAQALSDKRSTLTAVICDQAADCMKVAKLIESEILVQKWRDGRADAGPSVFVMDRFPPQRPISSNVRFIAATWAQLAPNASGLWEDLVLLGFRQPPRRLGGWDFLFSPARPPRTVLRIHDYCGAAASALSSPASRGRASSVGKQPELLET